MANIVVCTSCSHPVEVPEVAQEQVVRCPRCGAVVRGDNPPPPLAGLGMRVVVVEEDRQVSAPGEPLPPPPPPLKPVLVSSSVDEGTPDFRPRACPVCGERLTAGASRCPYCREDLDDDQFRPWERPGAPPRRDLESHRGPMILTLGVVSLLFSLPALCGFAHFVFGVPGMISIPLGLAAWTLGRTDVEKMHKKIMDDEGLRGTDTGKACGLLGAILGAVGLILCGIVNLGRLIKMGP
jgi:predicted RNA-binding Zn-ribbon protein involved in translation (DUF1610 family)